MKIIAASAVALSVLAAPAAAATINVQAVNSSNVFADENGNNKWYVGTSFMVGSTAVNNVGAGVFRVKGTDESGFMTNFLAFCLQPLERLTLPKLHRIKNPFTSDVSADLQALASNGWDLVQDRVSAAAFQLAAWEIVTEDQGYDIQAGTFKVTGNGSLSNQAEGTAQDWLDLIADNTWTAGDNDYQTLTATGTQDLLTNVEILPTPLPASGMLLIAGLVGAGAVARRRKS